MTLADFLLARIADDEADVRDTLLGSGVPFDDLPLRFTLSMRCPCGGSGKGGGGCSCDPAVREATMTTYEEAL